jgi:hypothetical protein
MFGFAAIRVLTGLLGLFVPIVLARNMILAAYADYALLLSMVMLVVVAGSLGYDRGAFRFVPPLYAAGHVLSALQLGAELILMRLLASIVLATGVTWVALEVSFVATPIAAISAPLFVTMVAIIATTEGLTVTASAFALHRTVATIGLLILLVRSCAFAGHLWIGEEALTLEYVIRVTLWTESLQAALVALAVLRLLGRRVVQRDQLPQSTSVTDRRVILKCCLSAWGAYLTAMPTQGPALRLLVGVFADTASLAAFAFFQQLADRAKAFLPLQLVLPSIETSLSARRVNHVRADATVLGALTVMARVNLFVLCIALVVLIAAGPEIEHLLTKDRFGQHLLVAALLIGQLMFSSIESALWSAYNAAGDAVLLNRASMISSLIAVPIVMAAGALTGAIGVAAVAGFRVVILASMLLKVEGGEPARCLLTCPVGMRSFAVALLSLGVTFWAVLVFQTTRGSGFSSLLLALIVFGSSAGLLRFAKLSEISTVARLVNAVR